MEKDNLILKTYKTIDEQIEYLKVNKKIIVPKEYRYALIEQNYVSLINAYKEFFSQGVSGPKKLDNRNQVKIKKISMIFHGFYCTLKIPEEKALFFRVV